MHNKAIHKNVEFFLLLYCTCGSNPFWISCQYCNNTVYHGKSFSNYHKQENPSCHMPSRNEILYVYVCRYFSLLLGVCGVRGMSISGAWPGRVMIMGSSTTLMLLHCISSCSRLKISSAREHLNAKIPVEHKGIKRKNSKCIGGVSTLCMNRDPKKSLLAHKTYNLMPVGFCK